MPDYDHAETPADTPPAIDPDVDPKSAAEMEKDGEREGPVLKDSDKSGDANDVAAAATQLPPD